MEASLTLKTLLEGLVSAELVPEISPSGIAVDSRRVNPGDAFFALRGMSSHGLRFAGQVAEAGASCIVWEADGETNAPKADIPMLEVQDLSAHAGEIAARFYGNPSRSIKVIGITGTDGKSSCSHFIAQALNDCGIKAGVVGTLGYGAPGSLHSLQHTTPDAVSVQRILAELQCSGITAVAMEVSSHALDQNRVNGVHFEMGVFTNLSRDHLDYHGSVEAYAAAKRRLFDDYRPRIAILNLDDNFGLELAERLSDKCMVKGYSLSHAHSHQFASALFVESLTLTSEGANFDVHCNQGAAKINSQLLGRFNVSNSLATLAALLSLDVPFDQATQAVQQLRGVPGRMETFSADDDSPLAVVDFAHTPNALEQVLKALREHTRGLLWCVFGCGGDRDSGKRPLMGAVAENNADRVIVTNDNPRSENPDSIVRDILAGMKRPDSAIVETHREQAIKGALKSASCNDIVLVAGKGHEEYQLIGDQVLPFSDREIVQQLMGISA